MGQFLTKGTTYVDGVTQITATNLNAHLDNAIIEPTAISALTLKDPLSGAEEVMVNDGGTLKKTTGTAMTTLVSAVPVGVIFDFSGATAPGGFFFCYGQSISRVTYSALFAAIGTIYGTGDGSTTFNLPDLRGRVVAGKDDMGGTSSDRLASVLNGDQLGGAGGAEYVALTEAQLASHQHYFPGGTFGASYVGIAGYQTVYGSGPIGSTGGLGFTPNSPITFGGTVHTPVYGPTDHRGSNQGHANIQPTMVMNKIIKY